MLGSGYFAGTIIVCLNSHIFFNSGGGVVCSV